MPIALQIFTENAFLVTFTNSTVTRSGIFYASSAIAHIAAYFCTAYEDERDALQIHTRAVSFRVFRRLSDCYDLTKI